MLLIMLREQDKASMPGSTLWTKLAATISHGCSSYLLI